MKLVLKKYLSGKRTGERGAILFEARTQWQVTEDNKTWGWDIFERESITEPVPTLC